MNTDVQVFGDLVSIFLGLCLEAQLLGHLVFHSDFGSTGSIVGPSRLPPGGFQDLESPLGGVVSAWNPPPPPNPFLPWEQCPGRGLGLFSPLRLTLSPSWPNTDDRGFLNRL